MSKNALRQAGAVAVVYGDGDGAGLSGGQASAFCSCALWGGAPGLMTPDEATVALDVAAERAILGNVRNMGITTILFAHRSESAELADRVVTVFLKNSNIATRKGVH